MTEVAAMRYVREDTGKQKGFYPSPKVFDAYIMGATGRGLYSHAVYRRY